MSHMLVNERVNELLSGSSVRNKNMVVYPVIIK